MNHTANTASSDNCINISKFINELHKLQSRFSYIIEYPEDLTDLIHILKTPDNRIIGITINTDDDSHNPRYRIRIKSGADGSVCGVLKCKEMIKVTENCGVHRYFNFHFEADCGQSASKTFRFDFNPKQTPPLHAHRYSDIDRHLVYPEDTLLKLFLLDFCTIMHTLSYYIKHPEQYPLDDCDIYNKLISDTRRIYNDI